MQRRILSGTFALGALLGGPVAYAEKHESAEAKFEKMDVNADGKVSREEYSTFIKQHCSKIDSNGDGFVSLLELTTAQEKKGDLSAAQKIKKYDTSGDGKLSVEELVTAKQARFDGMDTNSDGSLSQIEVQTSWKEGKEAFTK